MMMKLAHIVTLSCTLEDVHPKVGDGDDAASLTAQRRNST